MGTLVLVVHLIVSVLLIGVVLLQSGKGASIGATFGGGNQAGFGQTRGTFMGKVTAGAAIVFMLTSLTLAYFSSTSSTASIMKGVAISEPAVEAEVEQVPPAETALPETGTAGDAAQSQPEK